MKVAVTGANGFVGRYLIEELLLQGDKVLAIGWINDPFKSELDPLVERRLTDFSTKDLTKILYGVDAVVHLSAMRTNRQADLQGYHPYYLANVLNTENLIHAAHENHIPRICQASSIAVYSAANKVPYKETDAPKPLSLYGLSKLSCEHLADLYMKKFPVRIVSLRFAQIFGYGEIRGLAITRFIEQARAGQQMVIWGKGITARDYVYVRDIVSAIKLAISSNAPSGVFNIGGGIPIALKEVAETIKVVFDCENGVSFDLSMTEQGDSYFMDCALAQRELGWRPTWNFRSALEDMKFLYDENRLSH